MWAYHKQDGTPAPKPIETNPPMIPFGKTHEHTGRDGGAWLSKNERAMPRTDLARVFWLTGEEREQVMDPINTWKDREADETVYTPRLIVLDGPVTRRLTDGEVLFQSQKYTNPLIMRADKDERE